MATDDDDDEDDGDDEEEDGVMGMAMVTMAGEQTMADSGSQSGNA